MATVNSIDRKKSTSMDNLRVPSPSTNNRPQSIGCDPSSSRPVSFDHEGSSENGVSLLSYRRIHHGNPVVSKMRWHSDTNLALNPHQMESRLSVNKTELDIVEDEEGVMIHWDIKENVSAKDWIGLYKTNEIHPGKWLDYRNRGVSGSRKGELVWHFERIASAFTEPETRVCFRYYHGNTSDLRAVTESILVINSEAKCPSNAGIKRLYSVDSGADIVHLAIQDIEAAHVKKGMFFNPDPYVKIRIEPGQDRSQPVLAHHYKDTRTTVCENTTEPRWDSEIFHFMALPSDDLFLKVKDRFTTSRPTLLRFLGQISIPIKQVMERAKLGLTVNCQLMGRSPHDHVSGTLVFKPTLIPYDAARVTTNGESALDSSVERALDRSSASVLTDTSLSSSDEESESTHGLTKRPTIRVLTHTSSATSGDSSIDMALSTSQTTEDQKQFANTQILEDIIADTAMDLYNSPDGDSEYLPRANDSDQMDSVDALPSMETSSLSLPDTEGLHMDVSSTSDIFTAYKREAEENATGEVLTIEPISHTDSESEISEHKMPKTVGESEESEEQTSITDVLTESTKLAGHVEEPASLHNNIATPQATGEEECTEGDASRIVDGSECKRRNPTLTGEPEPDSSTEKRRSVPPPDFPPPALPAHIDSGIGLELSGAQAEVSEPELSGAQAEVSEPDDASITDQMPSLAASGNKSASVWSLENHAGSVENICDEVRDTALPFSPTVTEAQNLANDISNYMNMSSLVSCSNKSTPTTPDPEHCPKQKRPLPQPRPKTLAEQLDNLQVIESAIAPAFQPKPPDLPVKAKSAKSKESSVTGKPPSHTKVSSGSSAGSGASNTSASSGIAVTCKGVSGRGATHKRVLESEGSLEMPSNLAPLPPSGAKPKKPTNHHEIAEQYGSLDIVDAKPKKVSKSEEPPVLKPRKGRTDRPPQLPPRRQRADGSLIVTSGLNDSYLDEVFEPHYSSRQHHRHHRTKIRTAQTPSTESEEARVASEVANAAASLPRPHHMKSESIEVEEALPTGWEARVDAHGRVFYIDHHNKVTTWERPTNSIKRGQAPNLQQLQRVPSISNNDRQNMDHRYRNIRRMASVDTINERSLSPPRHHAPPPPPGATAEAPQATSSNKPSPVFTLHAPTEGPASSSAPAVAAVPPKSATAAAAPVSDTDTRNQQEVIRNSPAVKFLTRTDFFSLVQYSDEAQVAYTSNSALKHMVHKIRKDPMTFHKYWHNKDLVNFLNMFVNRDDELPGNWQMKHDKTGKVFFLDHSTKTTTFIDPRLPTVQPLLTQGPQMPLPLGRYRTEETSAASTDAASDLLPTAYNEKVVLFLRQPNILQMLQDRYPMFKKNESLRNKINTIISDGTLALKKYRNHVELTILLSMFENEIMSFVPAHFKTHTDAQTSPKGSPALGRRHVAPPYKRDFQEKYRTFLRKLEGKGIGQGPGKTKMRVRRDHILEDSFKKVMSYSKKDLQKNKLLISFLGEEGLDYGGPAREFFFLLSRELFNPYYGLFEYSANDTYTVQISSMSTFVDNAAEWFRFAGRMIGLCIVHQFLMDSFFTRPFYKMLLREPCVLSDLESLDAEFHQSLLWIKDNDISEAGLDLTFSVDEEVFGQVTERELKPNGMNISVTNRNKKEYIEKMVTWRIDRGVNEQKEHLLKGFYEVIEPKLVSIFDAKDLELVIAGTAEIDIVDWRNNTEYRSGYYDSHPVVDWFWEVIESFDNEKRLRLLQFVTGTSSIPFEGFSALRGSNGPRKFTIEKWGTAESLPRAHTCFNRLDLPTYTARETMQDKLLLAISETSTFGIE